MKLTINQIQKIQSVARTYGAGNLLVSSRLEKTVVQIGLRVFKNESDATKHMVHVLSVPDSTLAPEIIEVMDEMDNVLNREMDGGSNASSYME